MLKKRKKKASSSMIDLNLKPSYPTKIATKPDSIGYVSPKYQTLAPEEEIFVSLSKDS